MLVLRALVLVPALSFAAFATAQQVPGQGPVNRADNRPFLVITFPKKIRLEMQPQPSLRGKF